jgi:short subunit fatty acids transporter
MTIKQTLGESTEQLEKKVKELTPFYTNLEPWQRGIIIIALILFLLFAIHYLTKPSKQIVVDNKKELQKEKEIEEKILRQMAFFKRLKE